MDACDPGINIKDLKTLIKKNTGGDLKLTRSQICDVYSSIQDGELPFPPLVLSKDRSYLLDRKSPLTQSDFQKLFSSDVKATTLRRIAKKVGVSRHADKTLTKSDLKGIIGRRLRSLNIHEPVKLRSVQRTKIIQSSLPDNTNAVMPNNNTIKTNNSIKNITNNGNTPNRNNLNTNTKGINRGNNSNRTNIVNSNRNNKNNSSISVNNNKNNNNKRKVAFGRAPGGFLRKEPMEAYKAKEALNRVNSAKKGSDRLSEFLFGRPKINNKNAEIARLAKKRLFFQQTDEQIKKTLWNKGLFNMSNNSFKNWLKDHRRETHNKTLGKERKVHFASPTNFRKGAKTQVTGTVNTKSGGSNSEGSTGSTNIPQSTVQQEPTVQQGNVKPQPQPQPNVKTNNNPLNVTIESGNNKQNLAFYAKNTLKLNLTRQNVKNILNSSNISNENKKNKLEKLAKVRVHGEIISPITSNNSIKDHP